MKRASRMDVATRLHVARDFAGRRRRILEWTRVAAAFLTLWASRTPAQPTVETFGTSSSSEAQSPPLTLEVSGRLQLTAEARRTADEAWVQVIGRVTDENDVPQVATLDFSTGRGTPNAGHPCDSSKSRDAQTALDGTFCRLFRASEMPESVSVRAPHFRSAESALALTGARTMTRPSFVSAPSKIEAAEQSYVVELLASADTSVGAEVLLELECGSRVQPLGAENIQQRRMVRFEFTRPPLPPGECLFLATVRSPADSLTSTRNVLLLGIAQLTLSSVQWSDDRVRLELAIEADGTPVEDGVVEARFEGEFRGTAQVRNGRTSLTLERDTRDRRVSLAFLPAHPAHVSGKPIEFEVERRPEGWSWALWHSLLLTLFGAWIVTAWLRPKRRIHQERDAPPERPVLEAEESSRGHIRGRVLDAHSLAPVAGVALTLSRRGAVDRKTLASSSTAADGSFSFDQTFDSSDLILITCEHARYMTFEASIVAASARVYLQRRRRALVDQLVGWAKHRGFPWDTSPAATTGHVERVADERGESGVARWAGRVEEAAYGPIEVEETTVLQLREPSSEPQGRRAERPNAPEDQKPGRPDGP